jgi:alcohol dehydrogenase class IV
MEADMSAFDFVASKMYEFRAPGIIHFGLGCLKKVGSESARFGKRAFVVTDRNIREAGYVAQAVEAMKGNGVEAVVFDQVNAEPSDTVVGEGLRAYREAKCDVVVALGGGSPIDAGKAIAALSTNTAKIADFMGVNKIAKPAAPIIAIPTTAGTGSEVTRFTIITDTSKDVKMLIVSDFIMPQAAIVDPLLTPTMPDWVSSSTAVDALTHAIESYISRKAQPLTETLALEAIRLISAYLRRAWANPEDLEAKHNVMLGATVAGMAFSNSSVAMVHGMSRPIGANFHVPHGQSNAILLPLVMEFSCVAAPEKFADIADAMGVDTEGLSPMEAAMEGIAEVQSLCEDVQIPTAAGLKLKEDEFMRRAPKMAEDGLASGSPGNNPRRPTKEEIVQIYGKLFK